MDRLTFEGNFCDISQCREVPGNSFCKDGACDQRKTWEKLKRFEDLQEQGRLVELPCKVGDTVYVIYDAEVEYGGKAIIEHCTVSEVSTHRVWIENNTKVFIYADVGKTVFLTKAEAQTALDRMGSK